MMYTVKIEYGDNLEDSLLFSFEDAVKMDQFLRLYFESRNEIFAVNIYAEEYKK